MASLARAGKKGYDSVLLSETDGGGEAVGADDSHSRGVEDGLAALKSFAEAGGESDFITIEDFQLVEYFADYDAGQLEEDVSVTPDRVKAYFQVLVKALESITDEAVINVTLNLMAFVTEVVYTKVSEEYRFVVAGASSEKLIALLQSSRLVHVQSASKVLGYLAVCGGLSAETFDRLVMWMKQVMTDKTEAFPLSCALQTAMVVVREEVWRDAFVEKGGINLLASLCDVQCGDHQRLYEVCFSLWVLSYSDKASECFAKTKIIETLCDIVQANFREKLTRVAIAALVNLVPKQNGEHCQTMAECDLLETLKDLSESHWADPDVVADIDELKEAMQKNYRVLSSFERYRKEVLKGELKWGPVHSEKFFRDNSEEMASDDFLLVRTLVDLLRRAVGSSPAIAKASDSNDPKNAITGQLTGAQLDDLQDDLSMVSVAVACYDLGEFMRFYPSGKRIIVQLGAKTLVMALLEHEDDGVQTQALACCSKIMVSNWDQIVGRR